MKEFNVNLEIKYINKKLVGTPRKILDCSIAKKMGWKPSISIFKGIKKTVEDFKKNYNIYK
jgi:GDP-L-fucose synthase